MSIALTPRKKDTIRQFGLFMLPYKSQIAVALLATTIAAATLVSIGQGLRYLVDQGFGSAAFNYETAILLLAFMALVLGSASFLRSYLASWIGEQIIVDIKQKIFNNLLQQPPEFHETKQVGEMMATLESDSHLIHLLLSRSATTGLRSTLQFLGAFIFLFLTSPQLAGLTCLASLFALLPLFLFGKKVYKLSTITQQKSADAAAYCQEKLSAVLTVQTFGREESCHEHYHTQLRNTLSFAHRNIVSRSLMSASVIVLITLCGSLILWTGGQEIIKHHLTSGMFIAFVFYAVIVAGSLGNISEAWGDMQRALGAAERVFALLPLEKQTQFLTPPSPLPTKFRGDIECQQISFAYPTRSDNKIFDKLSLTIKHGDTVAIVGSSGTGKSTLLSLLLRFYRPQQGQILLDGINIEAIPLQKLRHIFGWLPQEPVLFSGSVYENIRFASPHATFQDIEEAARQANALEFIRTLSDGFATEVGERGVQLSIGQKQRLALARIFLQNPRILLLDEATTALDADNAHLIQNAIDQIKIGRTTIMITHHLSTILNVDRIIVINQGQIVASGNHTTLMRQSELYRRFVALQFQDHQVYEKPKMVHG